MSATLVSPVSEQTPRELVPDQSDADQARVGQPDATQVVTAGPPTSGGDAEFAAFGKAILFGILLGIPILGAAVVLSLKALAPSMDNAAVIGVAVWVALFCGPFLAGTVTVGLSSKKWH